MKEQLQTLAQEQQARINELDIKLEELMLQLTRPKQASIKIIKNEDGSYTGEKVEESIENFNDDSDLIDKLTAPKQSAIRIIKNEDGSYSGQKIEI